MTTEELIRGIAVVVALIVLVPFWIFMIRAGNEMRRQRKEIERWIEENTP